MTKPLVSVVMPAYNAEKTLETSLLSALNQSYRPMEIVVVDDGSSDRSLEIARSFGLPVRALSQENGGPGRARNRGISEARGELIAFLDSDDLWCPEKLARQVALFRERPELALLYTGYRRFSDEHPAPGREVRVEAVSGRLFHDLYLGRLPICTSSVMVRRSHLEQVGGFDPAPEVQGAEDFELWLRLSEVGEIASLPDPLACYRVSELGHNRSNIERAFGSSGTVLATYRARFLERHGGMRGELEQQQKMITFRRGLAYFHLRNFPEARRWFLKTVRLSPTHHRAMSYLLLTFLNPGTLDRLRHNPLLSSMKAKFLGGVGR